MHRRNPVEFEMAARGRARREALGLTATELGHRMALSCARISQIEASGAGTVDLVRRWAKALEMSPSELAFGEGALSAEDDSLERFAMGDTL